MTYTIDETTNSQNNNESQASFIDFNKALMVLVGDLSRLQEFSQKLNLEKSIKLIGDVIERVKNKTFSVAVVGEFKRGKSTFINALLGMDILPSAVKPTTATLNRVTYGLTPSAKVIFKDGQEQTVEIEELKNYVTKLTREAEKTADNVKEAIVYYPLPYCQNNVDIIDTPGLNDEANMDKVTLAVLPEVDAAIMVIMVQAPFAESERLFLENKLITNDLGRIIFVATGIDRCNNNPGDADAAIEYIQECIQEHILQRAKEEYGENSPEYTVYEKKIGTPKVFGLSAYQALQAKTRNDNALLTQSRFPEFEKALEEFLIKEKGATFLQVPVNRVIASASEIIQTIDLQEEALGMKQEEFRIAYEKSMAEIQELRNKNAAESKRIDAAARTVKTDVQPLVWEFGSQLKQATIDVINNANIKPTDIENQAKSEKLCKELGNKITNALDIAVQRQAEKIQNVIEAGLVKEIDRLKDFALEVATVLRDIKMQFSVQPEDKKNNLIADGGALALSTIFPIFGGIYAGFKEAGAKGGVVGGLGTIGTAFAAGLITTMIGIPITFPVIVAVGIISFFTGGKLAKMIFGQEQVETFKAEYKKAVMLEIDKQLTENHMEQMINEHIFKAFDAIKEKVNEEIEAVLDNTQNTLNELSKKRERDEVMAEHERQELEEMRKETDRILGHAQGLSKELIQQINLVDKLVEVNN